MMNKKLDSTTIRSQIDNLLAAYPELKDDDVLRADMFEGATDLHEYLLILERQRRAAHFNAEGCDQERKEIIERRDRMRQREQALRRVMFAALQWADLEKVDIKTATISIQRAGPVKVIITDLAAIPDEFIVREPNKRKIKDAIDSAGPDEFDPVPGASLSNAEPALHVRIK